jgi:hypothetical protein
MDKPAITKLNTKAAALTYSELDTNFQNLADATVTLTAGTAGTAVTSDLNGNITLVAGSNVTITGNNTAKTVTIAATSSGSQTPWTANIDMNGYYLYDSTGNPRINDDLAFINGDGPVGNGNLRLRASTASNNCEVNMGKHFVILQNAESGGLVLGIFTSTQRDALTGVTNGMMIYNDTTGKFQGRAGGAWVDLH